MPAVSLTSLVTFLDRELGLKDFPKDECANGLQVEGAAHVSSIGLAVDACEAVFSQARANKVDFLFVHHGLIWGGLRSIRGITKKRIQSLNGSGISLYACHLPLDSHPRYGNNAQILRMLSLTKKGAFGEYHGRKISYWGRAGQEMALSVFCTRIERVLSTRTVSFSAGRKVRNVGVISGGGWFGINEAEELGIDTFLTGEPAHSAYHLAREMNVNLVFAGHYATETPGVKAVAKLLQRKFRLQTSFLDEPTGL
ncbi:MAG: Nif3-like dinuclear metal center hexameric protein [Thermodesulfovibrionales bacterium]